MNQANLGVLLAIISIGGTIISVVSYINALKSELSALHQRLTNSMDMAELKSEHLKRELSAQIEMNKQHLNNHCAFISHLQDFLEVHSGYQPLRKK